MEQITNSVFSVELVDRSCSFALNTLDEYSEGIRMCDGQRTSSATSAVHIAPRSPA